MFVLARDASGIVVVNNLPTTGFTDSTTLLASTDLTGSVAKGQTTTVNLHLKSNSTLTNGIIQDITVIATVQGNGITPINSTQTGVTIKPGDSVTVQFTFPAPSNVGSYTLTFYSPEYGRILTSQTLQVSILPSYQLLIPAGIGVAAAIIILGFYMFRGRRADKEERAEVTKPSPKPKPSSSGSAPAKSLTRTGDQDK